MYAVRRLLLFCIWVSAIRITDTAHTKPLNWNRECRVYIRYTHVDGKKSEKIFKLSAKNKLSCKKKAATFKANFAPSKIAKKSVKVVYE